MTTKLNSEPGQQTNEWDETSEGMGFVPAPITFIIGEDGIPTPTCAQPAEIREATETTLRCLHGPCDNYIERQTVKPATAGGIVTTTQRYCIALGSDDLIPTEITEVEITVCSAHAVAGKGQMDRITLVALRSENYCRGCDQHVELVQPAIDDNDEDEICDFCTALDSANALTCEVVNCTLHSTKGVRDE